MSIPKCLHDFLRTNKDAWQFAWKACDDYLLARLGIVNELWSSFEMATQAVEKLLKSYLLFMDPDLAGEATEVRKAVSKQSRSFGRTYEVGHDVEAALYLAIAAGLPCSADLKPRVARINSYYCQRYPDERSPASLSTAEITDIDEAVFEMWDAFKNINPDFYCTGGIMRPIYGYYLKGKLNPSRRTFDIMTTCNNAYDIRSEAIKTDIETRLAVWYNMSV